MAPGAKKNPKAKSKKALAVDFKRVKSKVGRKLGPAQNATKVEFKSKGIVIPGQSVTLDKDGLAVNQRKQTLKELLVQVTHYSERMRRDALMGLKDLFGKHPKELVMHAVVVIEKLSPRITDTEKSVRQALVLLLQSSILPTLPEAMMKPLVPVIMAHVCSAMTHLVLDIRIAACTFLDLLVHHCSTLVVPFFSDQIVQHYISLLGKGGISGQPGNRLSSVLSSLEHFLLALKQNSVTTRRTFTSSMTHRWGVTVDSCNLGTVDGLQALHAYKSALPEGNPAERLSFQQGGQSATELASQNTGRLGHISLTSSQLVPVLLECWAEYAPMVCNAPNPDASSLDCMVLITKCLSHIFQSIVSESAASSLARDMKGRAPTLHIPEYGSEEWETHLWMRQQFLPGVCRRLLNSYPMSAPVVRLLPKVEEGLVALNVGICEVMLQFMMPTADDIDNRQLDIVLEYFESASYGKMLPSSEFSEGVSDPKLSEPHVKTLVSYLPGLITCVSSDWVPRLLQAFTHVFESCNSRSSTKMICLSTMAELVLPGSTSGKKHWGKLNAVPLEFQTLWLRSLPKLLWELKHLHSNVSQAVLEMLLYIGRSSAEGSALAESYTGLQQAMVPFFCTFLPSKQKDETRCLYGPFIKLPQSCQELAADLLYFYTKFSPLFLKVLAQCSLCPDLDVSISIRIVELLQRAFCRGDIGLGEHLSFLFTLLVGRVHSQGDSSFRKPPPETDASSASASASDYDEDLELKIRQRHSAITGVVCACLAQFGDGNIVLSLLGPSIRAELENQKQLRVVHGLFRAVAVLSRKVRHSDGLFLPDSLVDVLPKSAANFLVTVAELGTRIGDPGKEPVLNSLRRPCIILMGRSSSFTVHVLEGFNEFLRTEVHPQTLRHAKKRISFAQVVLEIIKTEKLDKCLSSSKDTVKAIMQTIEANEDTQTVEGRELKRLHEQLQVASNALFGSGFFP
ncbi:unnamed protein product [Calypogeia fissa]